MASSFQFGSFVLGAANNVIVNVVREKSPAEMAFGLLQPARSRGVSIVSMTPKAKTIEIVGTVRVTGSINTYTDSVRDFIAAFMQQADFYIGTTDGLFLYEDCVCLNPQAMFREEDHFNIDFIKFRAELLAPKGVAISSNVTSHTFNNISTSPYTNQITVGGTAVPEPIITLTLDSTGGAALSNLTFLNRDTNESISIPTAYHSDDVVVIDTAEKRVTYNTKNKRFTGLLPRFNLGTNRFKVDVATATSLHQSQETSDDVRSVYGSNQLYQRITPSTSLTVPQIDLLLKKIETAITSVLDTFNSGSISSSIWLTTSTTGTVSVVDGKARLYAIDGSPANQNAYLIQNSNLLSAGQGCAFSVEVRQSDNSSSSTMQGEMTNGTDYIRIRATGVQPSYFTLESSSYYGSLSASLGGSSGVLEIKQVGADIEIYWNGSLQTTITGKTTKVNSYVKFTTTGRTAGTPNIFEADNVLIYSSSNANSDITVELRSVSANKPSASVVGTATIRASDVATDGYTIIPVKFSTNPALSNGVSYALVVRQTGGDVNNYFSLKVNTSGGYSSGEDGYSNNAGSTWTALPGEDIWFRLYNAFPTGFNVDLGIQYPVTHHSVV